MSEALRTVLPDWVRGGCWWLLVGLQLLGWLSAVGALAVARVGRPRDPALHWTERARLGWPIRVAQGLCSIILPIMVGALSAVLVGPWCPWPRGWMGLGQLVLAVVWGLPLARWAERDLRPARTSSWADLRAVWTTWALLIPHLWWFLLLVGLMPAEPGPLAWGLCVVGLAGVVGIACGAQVPLLRAMGWLTPADERLQGIVARTSAALGGVAVRSLDVLPSSYANALAYPLAGRLVFFGGALEALDDEQLAAVTAHELGHLSEPALVRWARYLTMPLLVGLAALRFLVGRVHPLWLVGGLALWLVVSRILRRMARRMEERADEVGQGHAGGPVYARALELIYQVNLNPVVLQGEGHTHPHLYDRLTAAGVEPAYPRPEPPPRGRQRWMMLPMAGLLMTLAVVLGVRRLWLTPERALAWLALRGGASIALEELALFDEGAGRWRRAELLYAELLERRPGDAWLSTRYAVTRIEQGDCAAGRAELALTTELRWEGEEEAFHWYHDELTMRLSARCGAADDSGSPPSRP